MATTKKKKKREIIFYLFIQYDVKGSLCDQVDITDFLRVGGGGGGGGRDTQYAIK